MKCPLIFCYYVYNYISDETGSLYLGKYILSQLWHTMSNIDRYYTVTHSFTIDPVPASIYKINIPSDA